MEENKFDPLQFIGFLLISAILMFWFYDNQSNYVENQQDIVVENPIEKFEDNSNTLNLAKEDSNKVELDKKFKEEIITLENDKILFEISTSGADINVYASESLNAKATSGGDVDFRGNPKNVDKKESSGGDISAK